MSPLGILSNLLKWLLTQGVPMETVTLSAP